MTDGEKPINMHIHIAAGGESSRMRQAMNEMNLPPDYPKHLLPTGGPDGETLLGRIVRQARTISGLGRLTLYANSANLEHIKSHPSIPNDINIVESSFGGPLGPLLPSLINGKELTIITSGDYYISADFDDIMQFHNNHALPVTYVAGKSPPTPRCAVLDIDNHVVVGWHRHGEANTDEEPTANVGIYIFSPEHIVLDALSDVERIHDPEPVTDALIARRLVAGYQIKDYIFNVNNPVIYEKLLELTQQETGT